MRALTNLGRLAQKYPTIFPIPGGVIRQERERRWLLDWDGHSYTFDARPTHAVIATRSRKVELLAIRLYDDKLRDETWTAVGWHRRQPEYVVINAYGAAGRALYGRVKDEERSEEEEIDARKLMAETYERINAERNCRNLVPIPLLKRALASSLPPGAINDLLREMELDYVIDLQPVSHPDAVPAEDRRLGISDPYRGLLYYVYWRE